MKRSEQIIWAAGFFDGEGCIGGFEANKNQKRSTYSFHLTVDQVDKAPLLLFQKLFGGNLTKVRQCWRLRISSSKIILNCIQLMYPFLVVKKKEAKQFLRLAKVENWLVQTGHAIPEEVIQLKKNVALKLKQIKDEKYNRNEKAKS